MYECLDCGYIFEEGDQVLYKERHGLDSPPYEQWWVCPKCAGAFKEYEEGDCDEGF